MIVKLGFLVTASVAVYAVKKSSIKSSQQPASTKKHSGNGEILSKQDQNEKGASSTTAEEDGEEVTGITNARSSNSKHISAFDDEKEPILPECRYDNPAKLGLLLADEKFEAISKFQAKKDYSLDKISQDNHVTELAQLQNQIKEMMGSIVTLERELVKSYKLKQQDSEVNELQRDLKIRTAEIERLHVKINKLQEERKKLQEEIEKGASAMKQLEMAKRKIKRLQSQIEIGSNQMQVVLMLEQHITSLQSETVAQRDTKADKHVKVLEILEFKILELKRKNKELQLEIRDLTLKLIAAKSKIKAYSNVTESEVVSELEEEVINLKIANEDLSNQIERIQNSKFNIVEELVYQLWVNACLKHEIQNHKMFSMTLSPETQKNISKKLAEYATSNESEEFDTTTNDSSNSRPTETSDKQKLLKKIKWWRKRKDDSSTVSSSGSHFEGSSSSSSSLKHRSSMSKHPSEPFMPHNADDSVITLIVKEQDSAEFSETPKPCKRRVSFNDPVDDSKAPVEVSVDNKHPANKDCQNLAQESENYIKEEDQPGTNRLNDSLDLNLNTGSQAVVKGTEQVCGSGVSIAQPSEGLLTDKQVMTKLKSDHSKLCDQRRSTLPSTNHDKIETQELHFGHIFYFLLLIFLVYLLFQVAGVFWDHFI